jgi:hypothetical protein
MFVWDNVSYIFFSKMKKGGKNCGLYYVNQKVHSESFEQDFKCNLSE